MKTFARRVLETALLVSVLGSGAARAVKAQTAAAATSKPAGQAQPRARITEAIDTTERIVLRGNVHPLARAEFDQGAVEASESVERILLLLERSPDQQAALSKLIEEQQTATSPNFHKWLTPEQFGKQFGPVDADIEKVKSWLAAEGFRNIKVGAGRTAIEFSGSAGTVESAFHTALHRFSVPKNGKIRQANVKDPEIPTALSPVVAGIVSLNNFPRKSFRHVHGQFTRQANGRIVPQFSGGTAPNQFFAVGPADFATIYNTQPLLSAGTDGSGVTIAVAGTSNIDLQDVRDFRALFGLTANDPTIVLNGPDPGLNDEEGEAALDVEWSGAVAPGATIDFVVTEDTTSSSGVDLSALYVIDNNSADILSVSFGACEASLGTAGNQFFNALWEQAAAEGITVAVATGDPGSAGCDDFTNDTRATLGLAVSGIASTPFNVAVGGTDFDDAGTQASFWNATNTTDGKRESAKGYIPEKTWNDSCAATAAPGSLLTCANATSALLNIVAGSGGPSSVYQKPSFQTALTPADSSRDIPDISLFASDGGDSTSGSANPGTQSFYVVCQADALSAGSSPSCALSGTFSFFSVGGTSASTPAFAGIMALVDDARGGRQGNANVVLYKIAATAANICSSTGSPLTGSTCALYDVTKGNISVPCAGASPNCSNTSASGTGVLVDPAHLTVPAWITATGYDYATGLGSLNVQNLVTAWAAALGTFRASKTTLSPAGPLNITHGQPVTFTATVSPSAGSGTPTGDVALVGPPGSLNGSGSDGALGSGTTTITTTTLPGGTNLYKAHYAGDSTFGPSDSNAVSVTVAKENSRLQMGIVTFSVNTGAVTSTNATTFEYGSPYILRFDVLNSTTSACQPLLSNGATGGCAVDATGNVTATDNGAALDAGTFPLNSAGHAEDQPIQLNAGTHNLSATYAGDASYNASGPVTAAIMVTKATTATSVATSVPTVVSGAMVTLTATISSNSNSTAGPSGTVQFLKSGANLGAAVTCTPAGATSSAGASCTATVTTAISTMAPILIESPRPDVGPIGLVALLSCLALACFLVAIGSAGRRRSLAYGAFLLFAAAAAGVSGCGGGSSNGGGGGPTSHSVTITATYSGDQNYSTSTSPATTITIE